MSRRARRECPTDKPGWDGLVEQLLGLPKFIGTPRPNYRRNHLELAEAILRRIGEERLATEVQALADAEPPRT